MKNPVFAMTFVLFTFAFALSARAEQPDMRSPLYQEIKNLSRKVDQIEQQNKSILETQRKILEEMAALKIRIRRT